MPQTIFSARVTSNSGRYYAIVEALSNNTTRVTIWGLATWMDTRSSAIPTRKVYKLIDRTVVDDVPWHVILDQTHAAIWRL